MTILGGQHRLQYGTTAIDYELVYSRRKTLAIHVYPDGSVVVRAPLGTRLDRIADVVRKRAAWILRHQRQFRDYAAPKLLPRRYVSGEAYRYLGRQLRLKLVSDTVGRVRLSGAYLVVGAPDPGDRQRVARLVDGWYRRRARRVFAERLRACFPGVEPLGVRYPDLLVRAMKSRWGSCGASGRITLNLRLIQAPTDLIDYVVLHELCHLVEHNHSPAFYALLDRVLPDWRERRQALQRAELT
jgi:predicted metal-dependent hydrolase